MRKRRKKQVRTPLAIPEGIPDDPPIRAWIYLAHSYHRVARQLERALDRFDLTLAQFEILARIHYEGPVTQTELAKKLLVTKGNICGLIDRMAKSKLVVRRIQPRDRRVNIVDLTKGGRKLLANALPDHFEQIRRELNGLAPVELKRLQQGLARLAVE